GRPATRRRDRAYGGEQWSRARWHAARGTLAVPGERRARILAMLLADGRPDIETGRLCVVSAEVVGVTGAGVMLMTGEVVRGPVCTTDAVAAAIEQLQHDLGEGPCIDAHHQQRPVLE